MISLTTTRENELKELYKELFIIRKEIENKYPKKQHSIFTCEIGEEYANSKIKFMLIGRCANGWSRDTFDSADSFSDEFVEKFEKANDFKWIIEEFGKQRNTDNTYNLETSRFWTYSRELFKVLTKDIKGHYIGARIWQDCIVQSDLYKISPTLKGNPGVRAQRMQKDICLALLKKEIEILKPTHILFVTDENWLFDEITGKLSKPSAKYEYIKLTGYFSNTKVIVTPHPGRNGVKKAPYVDECIKAFKELENQC